MLEEVFELLALHGLVDQQVLGNSPQLLGVIGEDLLARGGSLIEQDLHLFIDGGGGLLGIALGGAEVAADEDGLIRAVILDGAEPVAHAVAGDHAAGDLGGLLDVAGSAAGDIVQEQLLRDPAAQSRHDALKHLGLGGKVFVVLARTVERKAAGSAPGDDGDIVDRVRVLAELGCHRMAGLVEGGQAPGLVADAAALLLRAHLDLQNRLVHILHGDEAVSAAHGQQSRLVHQVLQIRAGEAGRASGDGVQVHVLCQMLVAGMDFQDRLAALHIRQAHIDLAVETAGAQQRLVQDVRPVGSRHDDNALVFIEAVQLDQQLVQGLLALVVAAAQTAASLPAHRVDLVDKDDGRSQLLGLVEQVAHTAGADAHIQLHKVGAGDGQELDVGLSRHGLGKQGLAGARRAHQQHALGDAGAHVGIGLRVLEEVHDLCQLFLFLVTAGNIREGLLILVFAAQAGAGLAEAGHAAGPCAVHPVHHHIPEDEGDDKDQQVGNKAEPPGNTAAGLILIGLDDALLALLPDQIMKILIKHREIVELIGLLDSLFLGVLFPFIRLGALGSCGVGLGLILRHGRCVLLRLVRLLRADLQHNGAAVHPGDCLEGLDPLLPEQVRQL